MWLFAVRNRSREIVELLGDLEKVRTERKKAKANKSKYTGVGNDSGMSFSSGGSRYGGFGSEEAGGGGGGGWSGGGVSSTSDCAYSLMLLLANTADGVLQSIAPVAAAGRPPRASATPAADGRNLTSTTRATTTTVRLRRRSGRRASRDAPRPGSRLRSQPRSPHLRLRR